MRAFDEWVRTGLRRVRRRYGPAWDAAPENAPSIRFLISGRGLEAPTALLGVLAPSQDRSGRTYPFTVACELPSSLLRGKLLAYLPLQANSFYTAAEPIVRDAANGALPYGEVGERLDQIPSTVSLGSSVPAEYARFKRQWTMKSLLDTLFGDFEDGRKYRLFKTLREVFLPQRNRAAPRLNYGLQFPLGTAKGPSTRLSCLWLDITLRLLDHSDAPLSFFWTPDVPDVGSLFFLLFVGTPRANAFFHLLVSENETDDLLRLGQMGPGNDAREALPKRYRLLLEDQSRPLQDVLQDL